MAGAQEDLMNAMIVTVCGVEPLAPASEVAEVLATRLGIAGASGRVLPWLIDVQLQGIPAHVWETSTMEQFLSPWPVFNKFTRTPLG